MGRQRGFGLLAYGLIALAVIGSLAGLYWKIYSSGFDNGKAEVQTAWDAANEAARAREAAASAKAASDLAAERKKRRVVVQERTVYVDREIEKLVVSTSCLSHAGVLCVNGAIDGKGTCRPEPSGTVPAAKPAG